MFSNGQYILSGVMILTATWIANKYLNAFGEKKKQSIIGLCAWVLYSIYQLVVEFYRDTPSIWKLICGIILIYLVSIFNYHWEKRNVFFTVCLFYTIWAIVEMIVFIMLQNIADDRARENTIGVVISKIIMIILVNLMSAQGRKGGERIVSFKYYIYLLFIPLGSIYIAHVFFSEQMLNSFSGMIVFSILLLLNIIIFEIYDKLVEVFRLEKEKIVYEQQLEIISRSTEEQKRIREEFHLEMHNWKNKLIVLKKSVEKCNKNDILEEIDRIINIKPNNHYFFVSGNDNVDAIINVKHIIAKEYGIDFRCKIVVPEELPFRQCDLGVVLGNAIDNAIDATKQCKEKQKVVDIVMGVKKEALVIIIKNPYEYAPIKNIKGEYLSTKNEKIHHGYGLKSIYKVAEKYGGEVVIKEERSEFIITIFMNLMQK